MKITVNSIELSKALATLSKGYHEDQVWLMAAKDGLVITVDDQEARWSLSIPAKVDTAGQAFTSFKRLMAYMPRTETGREPEARLEVTPKSLLYQSGTAKGHLPLVDSSLFPQGRTLEEATTKVCTIERPSFNAAVAACLPIVGHSSGFAYTSGVYLTTTALHGFAFATDRKQIVRKKFRCSGNQPMQFTVDAQQVANVSNQPGDSITCKADLRTARFQNPKFIADLAQYTANPPDVAAALIESHKKYPHTAEIPTAFLLEALQICDAVGGTRENFFAYLDLSPSGCRLRANAEHIDELNIDMMGTASAALKVYVNYHHLGKALATFHKLGLIEHNVIIKLESDRLPIVVEFGDPDEMYALSLLNPPGLEPTQ